MADQSEIKKVIQIDTGNSLTVLQEYRQKIDDLKSQISSLDQTSNTYKSTLEQLNRAEETLNQVMNNSTSTIDGANSAYNTFISTVSELEQELGNLNSTASTLEINEKIDDAASSVQKLAAEAGSSSQAVENLGSVASNAFNNGFNKAIAESIKHVLTCDTTIKGLIMSIRNSANAMMAAGETAATAEALATAGLTIIIDLIVLLIAYWDEVKDACGEAIQYVANMIGIQYEYNAATKEAQRSWDEVTARIENANESLSFQLRLMKAQGASQVEIAKAQLKGLQSQLEAARQNLNTALSQTDQGLIDQAWKLVQDLESAVKRAQEDVIVAQEAQKTIERANAEADQRYSQRRIKIHKDTNKQILHNTKDTVDQQQLAEKRYLEQSQESVHKALTSELDLLDEKFKKDKALYEKYGLDTTDLTTVYTQERAEIIKRGQDEIKKIFTDSKKEIQKELKEAQDERTKQYKEDLKQLKTERDFDLREAKLKQTDTGNPIQDKINELNATWDVEKEYYDNRINLLNEYLANFTGSAEEQKQIETELSNLKYEYSLKEQENNKKTAELAVKNAKEAAKAKLQATQQGLKIGADVFGALGDLAEENSVAYKALSIMEGTLNTASSAIAAYKSAAAIPLIGPYIAPIAAAAATAAGMANVSKMKSTTKENAGSVSTSTSAAASMPSLSMTNVSPLLDELTDTNRMTVLNERGNAESSQQNLRVYVVDQDIRDANNRAEVVESNVTF